MGTEPAIDDDALPRVRNGAVIAGVLGAAQVVLVILSPVFGAVSAALLLSSVPVGWRSPRASIVLRVLAAGWLLLGGAGGNHVDLGGFGVAPLAIASGALAAAWTATAVSSGGARPLAQALALAGLPILALIASGPIVAARASVARAAMDAEATSTLAGGDQPGSACATGDRWRSIGPFAYRGSPLVDTRRAVVDYTTGCGREVSGVVYAPRGSRTGEHTDRCYEPIGGEWYRYRRADAETGAC